MDDFIMQERGFTLFELVITLAILAILLLFGLPGLSQQISQSRTKTAALDLMQAIQHARTIAVFQNKRTVIRPSGLSEGNWLGSWEIFIDDNNDGERNEEEELLLQIDPAKAVSIYANQPLSKYVSFIGTGESRFAGRKDGGAFQAGTFRICPTDANHGAGYELILARSGRMRMRDIPQAECTPFK